MIHKRYRRIVFFAARLLVGFIFWDLFLPRIGLRSYSQKTRMVRVRRSAAAFRSLAVQMGGVLIKVGQFLSTRVDVLPQEFTDELKELQDEVPPEDFSDIRRVAETEYGCRLEEKFAAFESDPLAAASLGQVHTARLRQIDVLEHAGSSQDVILDVVVKIQRPNIEALINTDLAALRTVGNWLKKYPPIRQRADVPALINEFARVLYEEVDYLAEGRNAETFAENFKGMRGVRVPRVIWSHTTRRVLTLENVFSIRITDYEDISAAQVDRAKVAARLLDTYFKQIFEDGFFHADPHPGNLFVHPLSAYSYEQVDPGKIQWELTFVDFGMVGRLSADARSGLREMVMGVGTQDAPRVVRSFQMLGFLLPGADLQLIEKAGARIFDRYWGKSMTELSRITPQEVIELASEFRELIYRLPFQIPQDVIYLARTVSILSGICTGLDPQLNVWEHLAPYAQKLIAQEARNYPEVLLGQAQVFVKALLAAPVRIETVLGKFERGEIAVHTPDIGLQTGRIERAIHQVVLGIIYAALLLAGVQLYLAGMLDLSIAFFGAAGICLVWILFLGRRKPRA